MPKFKEKDCQMCGTKFQSSGPNHKYCSKACSKKAYQDKEPLYRFRHNLKNGVKVGVGSGGRCGSDNGAYKNNIAYFHSISSVLKTEIGCCERCGKDLFNATRGQWAVHHKDHDRSNNVLHNFELLCRRCHAIEHECWKAFEGVTTTERDLITGRYKRIETPSTDSSQ